MYISNMIILNVGAFITTLFVILLTSGIITTLYYDVLGCPVMCCNRVPDLQYRGYFARLEEFY